jgi:hypothetical protein
LHYHFKIARTNGLSDDELAEVVYHASGYAGFPAAATARNIAARALAVESERLAAQQRAVGPPPGIEPGTFSLRVRRSTD